MSWKVNVSQNMIITTGDGVKYYPLYKNPRKRLGLSAVAMEYNEIIGAEVIRGAASYRSFPMEIYFQGDDNIEVAGAFEKSARDRRPWKVFHPHYGDIIAQPTILNFSNSSENVTVISFELWETVENIAVGYNASTTIDAQANIDTTMEKLADIIPISAIDGSSVSLIRESVELPINDIEKGAVTDYDLGTASGAIAKGEAYLNKFAENPVLYMNQLAYILRTPARYYATVTNRINVIKSTYENLKNALNGALTLFEKIFFEASGGMAINAIAEASIILNSEIAEFQNIEGNLKSDYQSRNDVLSVSKTINELYNDYISTLGTFQSSIDNKIDSYYPDPNAIDALKKSVKKTTANLYLIASKASQERTYALNKDTALISAVHLLTGRTDNETVSEFIESNNLGFEEMFMLKKGRTLKYLI